MQEGEDIAKRRGEHWLQRIDDGKGGMKPPF
jgi:hypothetical protein